MTTHADLPAPEHLLDEEKLRAAAALEAEFGGLIGRFRRVVADNAQRLSPGLLPGSYKVFTTIAKLGPISSSVLAEQLQADKGQISRTIRELEALGLVERAPDPHDGRSSLLTATADGRTRLAAARGPNESLMARALVDWSLADIEHLSRLLRALSEGRPPESPGEGSAS